MQSKSALRYDELADQTGGLGDSHRWILRHIPEGATVLDCGCAGGFFARVLTEQRACTVDGLEYDPAAAAQARSTCRQVFVGSLNDPEFLSSLDESYDRIVFGDVLEHLTDPEEALGGIAPLLAPKGRILVSVPNVANWRLRWQLLRGRFNYEDVGLLDRTHLRFYTFETAAQLAERTGFRVLRHEFTAGPPPFIIGWSQILRLMRFYPNLLAYQTLLELERRGSS